MLDFQAKKYLYTRALNLKHYCHYHPISPAKWACDTCHIFFDKACMPDADEYSRTAFCPHCSQSMRYLNSRDNHSKPFWLAAGYYFRAPFQPEPVLAIVITTLVSMLFGTNFIASLLSSLFIVLCLSIYGSLCAQAVQLGSLKAPDLSLLFSPDRIKMNLGVSTIFSVCLFSPLLIHSFFGQVPAFVFATLTLSAISALLMAQIPQIKVTSSRRTKHLTANNFDIGPSPTWFQIIQQMRLSYLGLIAYVFLAYVITFIIYDFSKQHLPDIFTPTLTTAAMGYFTFSIFGLFAYVMRQNNAFLPMEEPTKKTAENSPNKSLNDNEQLKRLDADIDIAVKGGEFEHAIILLENELKRNSHSDLRRQQLYQLLTAKNNLDKLERYAQLFLRLMLDRGQIESAGVFIEKLKKHNPEFKLFDAKLSCLLAESFLQHKQYKLVLWLAKDAHTRFDPCSELADLYLLTAKTLLSKFNQKQTAQNYLTFICQNFPEMPAAESAKILQQHIQKARKDS